MSNKYFVGFVGALALVGSPAYAATFTTVDLTAIDGTSWYQINTQPVRIDFGAGFGTGTVTLTAIDRGVALAVAPIFTGNFPQLAYTKAIDGGDTLVSTTNGTGLMAIQSPSDASAGFDLNFTLDSGTFASGSLLTIGGLTFGDGITPKSYFSSEDFGAPLSTSLPSIFNGVAPLVQIGTDSLGPVYGAGSAGISGSRAFSLLQDTNSFSLHMMSDPLMSKSRPGINFSFATVSAVPEPGTWAMMILGFGVAGAAIRRRHAVLAPA